MAQAGLLPTVTHPGLASGKGWSMDTNMCRTRACHGLHEPSPTEQPLSRCRFPFLQGEEDAPAPPGPRGPSPGLWEGLSLPGQELSNRDYVPEEQEPSLLCKSLLGKGQTETSSFI